VFWAPMALAMMGGLVAATILTLTFLPALYALAFGVGATEPGAAAATVAANALGQAPAPLAAAA